MSKTFVALFALLALTAVANADRSLTEEGPGVWFKCKALAALRIRVFHGTCRGIAVADCKAVAKSINAVDKEFKAVQAFPDKPFCDFVFARAKAEAIAKAVAAVWTSALAKVKCDGVGWGCAFAVSNGEAWATAFAKAIAGALAEIGTKKNYAACYADVEALSVVFAEAASRSQAKVCQKGSGTAKDFEKDFAFSIQEAIAKALVKAFAKVCDKKGDATSLCFGEGSSGSDGKDGSSDGGSTGGGQLKPCAFFGGSSCCRPGSRSKFCLTCPGCRGGKHWTLKKDDSHRGGFKIWDLRNGNSCFCAKK